MVKYKRILIVVVLLALLVPIPTAYKDGGTQTFTALTYKIIRWNSMNPVGSTEEYKTGTEVHFFPNNFKNLSEYQ